MSEQETVFPKGIFYNAPRENAPDFVKGSLSIKSEDAIPFIKENTNEKGYVNLDMLVSKTTQKIYLKVNTYQSKQDVPTDDRTQDIADSFNGQVVE